MHRAYTEGAAEAGVHILCEKPMAVTEQECESMIDAASRNDVKLMIAYRLHFEMGNLSAIRSVRDGQIGEPRIFRSAFCQQVTPGNSRKHMSARKKLKRESQRRCAHGNPPRSMHSERRWAASDSLDLR